MNQFCHVSRHDAFCVGIETDVVIRYKENVLFTCY